MPQCKQPLVYRKLRDTLQATQVDPQTRLYLRSPALIYRSRKLATNRAQYAPAFRGHAQKANDLPEHCCRLLRDTCLECRQKITRAFW